MHWVLCVFELNYCLLWTLNRDVITRGLRGIIIRHREVNSFSFWHLDKETFVLRCSSTKPVKMKRWIRILLLLQAYTLKAHFISSSSASMWCCKTDCSCGNDIQRPDRASRREVSICHWLNHPVNVVPIQTQIVQVCNSARAILTLQPGLTLLHRPQAASIHFMSLWMKKGTRHDDNIKKLTSRVFPLPQLIILLFVLVWKTHRQNTQSQNNNKKKTIMKRHRRIHSLSVPVWGNMTKRWHQAQTSTRDTSTRTDSFMLTAEELSPSQEYHIISLNVPVCV